MAAVRSTSSIRQVGDERHGHLLSLNGFTGQDETGALFVHPFFIEFTLATYLAWKDFNERQSDILPHLPALIGDCDFRMSYEARDTQLSPIVAVNELLEATDDMWKHASSDTNSQQEAYQQPPFAIGGTLFSSVTQQVTTLASGLEVPQISGTATSMQLESSPLFARTIPTNAQDARAVMTYYASLGVTRIASVFINEPYGIQYNKALQEEAKRLGIDVVFFALERNAVDQSMEDLRQSQARYVFAIVLEEDWQMIMQSAHKHKVIGHPDYAWLVPDLNYLLSPSFGLDKETQSDLAIAMHGLGMISLQMESQHQHKFDKALKNLTLDDNHWQDFVQRTPHPELFAKFTPAEPAPFLFHYLIYDSILALGLAACATPGLFTGPELYAQLLKTEFEGLSGQVSFDPWTGTRNALSTQYRVDNLLLSKTRSTETEYKLDVSKAVWIRGDEVFVQRDFIYASNTTQPPAVLPPMKNYDHHLIPPSLQILGWSMGGAIMLLSLLLMVWTRVHRKKFIVSAAQPIFLYQLCLGTIIMSSAIIPMSMQGTESTPRLDKACNATVWLVFVGFVFCLSAVLAKSWRLQQVMEGAQGMRRTKVESLDVIKPFLALLSINVACLTALTLVSPYEYVRVPMNNYDIFGRSVEDYGRCQTINNWSYLFLAIAMGANTIGVLFASYQCYKVRHASIYFSETSYLTMSMASLLETTLLGAPILLIVKDNPTASFLTSTALLCIGCLAFLLPIFVFKYFHAGANYMDAKLDGQQRQDHADSLYRIAVEGHFFEDEAASSNGLMGIRRFHSSSLGDSNHSRRGTTASLFGGSNRGIRSTVAMASTASSIDLNGSYRR